MPPPNIFKILKSLIVRKSVLCPPSLNFIKLVNSFVAALANNNIIYFILKVEDVSIVFDLEKWERLIQKHDRLVWKLEHNRVSLLLDMIE